MDLRFRRMGRSFDARQGICDETDDCDRADGNSTWMPQFLPRHVQLPGAAALREAWLQGLWHAGESSEGAYSLFPEEDSLIPENIILWNHEPTRQSSGM